MMNRLLLTIVAVAFIAPAIDAQEPTTGPVAARPSVVQSDPGLNPSMANVTPEMWLYLQELQRHDNPHLAVRRKAEERAARRSHRIASRKWFGLSNSRPTVNPLPAMATYSSYWSGNASDPNRWTGAGPAVIRMEEAKKAVR